jgi:hypothetical protein
VQVERQKMSTKDTTTREHKKDTTTREHMLHPISHYFYHLYLFFLSLWYSILKEGKKDMKDSEKARS